MRFKQYKGSCIAGLKKQGFPVKKINYLIQNWILVMHENLKLNVFNVLNTVYKLSSFFYV